MPKIDFARGGRSPVEVEKGRNMMQALLAAGVPVASSCLGDGVCGKCRLRIAAGAANLSSPNETEKFLLERLQIPKDHRVSCQTEVLGDVTVDAGYW